MRAIRWAWAANVAAPLLGLALLAACAREEGPPGPESWVNPDLGSTAAPVSLPASALPFTGTASGGIHYLVVTGLPPDTPHFVALTGMSADADLFVLGDAAFSDYRCSSVLGGAADDLCAAAPLAGSQLYVEVYGYTGTETEFILDVW